MTQYLYPQNLKATANLWLWGLRDFAALGVAALLSIAALVQLGWLIPAAVTLCFGFLTIRRDDSTILDFIEYIRNAMKRVRKKDSSIILASQNIEDFLIPFIREFTKPLFSIPTHQFLFNAGQINPKEYMDALQVEPSEFELIKYPERGTCLYRCGNERYLLQVIAPEYKSALFGKAGGR